MKKSKMNKILVVNAYNHSYFSLQNRTMRAINSVSYDPSNFVSTSINHHELILSKVEIGRNMPDEDIASLLEIKAYEELGLDQSKAYIVRYIEDEGTSDNRLFSLFVTDTDVLQDRFGEVVRQTKYIDLLLPIPLLYGAIYREKVLSDRGVDCYIYFQEKDASVTFYRNGRYLYSKSIGFSLEQIYDGYCKEADKRAGKRIDKKQFFATLGSEGLGDGSDERSRDLAKVFSKIFMEINDIIIYVKRAFSLSEIDRSYIGTSMGTIGGLEEFSENYLELHVSKLNFDFGIEIEKECADQLQTMLAVLAMEDAGEPELTANMTIFKRAPAFHKRTSGQLVILTSILLIATLSYPLYFLAGSSANHASSRLLAAKEEKMKDEVRKYQIALKVKREEIEKLESQIEQLSKNYHSKEKLLVSIYDKRVNYRLKSELLYRFAKEISRFDVNIDKLSNKGDSFTISLLSKDEKEITKLIRFISEKYFDQIDTIDIEMISKNPESANYNGILKVDLR